MHFVEGLKRVKKTAENFNVVVGVMRNYLFGNHAAHRSQGNIVNNPAHNRTECDTTIIIRARNVTVLAFRNRIVVPIDKSPGTDA
jgi:hypothetical protein